MTAVLVDRRGTITDVIIGDHRRVYLPDIGRARAGSGRFRGLRLVRTHLAGEPLTRDDFTDLVKLRLDMVVSITADPDGYVGGIHWAHLVPEVPGGEPWEIQSADSVTNMGIEFDRFIVDLEDEFRRTTTVGQDVTDEKVILVAPDLRDRPADREITEMRELCRTAGVKVVDAISQSMGRLDPKTAVRRGKLEEITLRALQLDADALVFACDLSPNQLRNVAIATDLKVIDRTQLILDIFAARATSADGKLQVELAQLKYMLPRLTQAGSALSRLAGGIGSRGPGETKLEIDRRRARERMNRLEKQIIQLSRQRAQKRARRTSRGVPIVAIVGYTNAGKSTLLNTLTRSDVLSEDKLFATLDPTSRRLRFPQDREIVLTDTVGFIRDLPEDLVTAFRATLEELTEADLLLHVVDVSDRDLSDHMDAVDDVLQGLGVRDTRRLLAFNKIDLLDPDDVEALCSAHGAIPIQATKRPSLRGLVDAVEDALFAPAP